MSKPADRPWVAWSLTVIGIVASISTSLLSPSQSREALRVTRESNSISQRPTVNATLEVSAAALLELKQLKRFKRATAIRFTPKNGYDG